MLSCGDFAKVKGPLRYSYPLPCVLEEDSSLMREHMRPRWQMRFSRGPFSSFSRIFVWQPCSWTHNEGRVYHSCPSAPDSIQRRLPASSSYPMGNHLTSTGLQFPTNRTNIQNSIVVKSAKTSHCSSCLWDTSVYFLDISYTLQIHSVHGWKESEGTLNAAAKLCLVDFSMF